ncbi:hypothetical protein KEM56_000753, partial [Ascosphaera pollenicola]
MLLLAWALFMRLANMAAASNETYIIEWKSPRVNIIRDTIYIQGGDASTKQSPGGNPSSWPLSSKYLTFNLSQPFNNTSNPLKLLEQHDTSIGNALPDYYGGAMFADDYEFILYSGLVNTMDNSKLPDAQSIIVCQEYQRGETQLSNLRQPTEVTLQHGINRYVFGGASASAPSESLGFYFSGRHLPDWKDASDDKHPNITSQKLIIADLAQKNDASNWKNETIPDNIPGRPGAELVWVPVSDQGMLVVIGGSSDTVELSNFEPIIDPKAASEYMRTISLYDVKSHKWYQQNATGDVPPITAQFCAVLATDQENSIHNIYIYGGNNGTDLDDVGRDDVYVLTLPRFEWIKLYGGQKEKYG